jgi:Saccharopine dehydrogenase and related proteins
MKNILVLGAGRSSSYLIRYLLEHAPKLSWQVTIADYDVNAALSHTAGFPHAVVQQFDIHDDSLRTRLIQNAAFVISMLPPSYHLIVAKDCLKYKKNCITASYTSPEIQALHEEVRNAGLLFMNEMGLDPGIDHMSAMKIIEEVQRLGGEIFSFKSYCGGLVAPSNDDNPWHYKISWNPRNIIMAGKSGGKFLLNGFEKHIPYESLYHQIEIIDVPGYGKLAAYANRDSLSYIHTYQLHNIKTMLRATFRHAAFCKGWHAIISLGLTAEKKAEKAVLNVRDWFLQATQPIKGKTLQQKLSTLKLLDDETVHLLQWLELETAHPLPAHLHQAETACVLQYILEQKWKMHMTDKDMIVMHHDFEYGRENINARLNSTLIVEGEDSHFTAMSKTVGLPIAIFTKLFLSGKITNLYGVHIPVKKEIYKPVLKELCDYGIEFKENYID